MENVLALQTLEHELFHCSNTQGFCISAASSSEETDGPGV